MDEINKIGADVGESITLGEYVYCYPNKVMYIVDTNSMDTSLRYLVVAEYLGMEK